MTPNPEAREDCRRAAALVCHHLDANLDGMNQVLAEAGDDGRVSELIVALLDLYRALVPELRTETAQQLMRQWIARIANTPTS